MTPLTTVFLILGAIGIVAVIAILIYDWRRRDSGDSGDTTLISKP